MPGVTAGAGAAATGGAMTSGAATAGPGAAANPALPAAAAALAPDSPEGLLYLARSELGAGRVRGALDALDRFLSLYPAGMDEVYLLYGLAHEQNGPFRDIKKAYAEYKKLAADYPQSPFWDRAAERIAYIERHYLEIR